MIEFGQGAEAAVAEFGQDPAFDHLDRDLDLGLVARLPRARRQDRRAVVRCHLGVGAVEPRLEDAGLGDTGLKVVGHDDLGHAAEVAERAHLGTDPVGQRLRPGRLGVGEVGGAEHGDEDLRRSDLAAGGLDDLDRLTGEVDEHLLAGTMGLAHHRRELAPPGLVELAEAAQAVAVRMCAPVLLPEQPKRHAGSLQLSMDQGPVRLRAVRRTGSLAGE